VARASEALELLHARSSGQRGPTESEVRRGRTRRFIRRGRADLAERSRERPAAMAAPASATDQRVLLRAAESQLLASSGCRAAARGEGTERSRLNSSPPGTSEQGCVGRESNEKHSIAADGRGSEPEPCDEIDPRARLARLL